MIQMKNLSKYVISSGKSRSSRKIGENSQCAAELITTTMTADQRVRTLEIVISYIVKITFTLMMRKDHIGDLRDTHTVIHL